MPTIFEIKEQEVVETPLILFECELTNGTRQYWSTHQVAYEANSYQPRVLRHNLFELRWGAEDGVDTVSRVSVTLANADSFLSQVVQSAGWKGAKLTARFVFFDLKNDLPASESMVVFRGTMNPAEEVTEATIRLGAHNRLSLQRLFLPEVRIQRRCPWSFPANSEQRQEALDGGDRGRYSALFRCGYSADLPGGLGNLNGVAPYTSCDFTRLACEARGMFRQDAASHVTSRFGGVEFVPASILVRGHGERQMQASAVAENGARYNDFVPIHYGTVWTNPPVIFARNDGNLTRMEILLGMGPINEVIKVIVNGVEIPQGVAGTNMTATGWYNVVSDGGVAGGFNLEFTNAAGEPLGDPYGSMAYMAVSVPNRVSDGKGVPEVKVLLEGLRLPTYSTAGAFAGELFTNNPAWVMLDILRRSGWTADEIDLGSFARVAAYCGETITIPDLFGNTQLRPRFQCNLSMRRRRSVADWIRGVRQASRAYLTYGDSGLLELRAEASLAIQQPTKPAGSNSTVTLDGGWPAYEFGDGTNGFSGIARRQDGESTVRLSSRSTAESPNRVSIEFQDQFNEYQQDSLSLVDTEDVGLTRQEVSVTSPALGVPNFQQAARILRLQLDRSIRGNQFITFETSVRALGLRPGDLITITYLKEGLQRQKFRVTRMVPALNHATTLIEAQIHDDVWYGDDPGSAGGRVARRQPGADFGTPRPLVGAQLTVEGEQVFSVEEFEETEGDGTSSVFVTAGFTVPRPPASIGLDIPALSLSPAIDTSGGSLAGGRVLYYAVTAADSAGNESELSFTVRASLPLATNTNKVTLQALSFAPGTTAFHVYRGDNPQQMLRIASNVPLASTFADTGLSVLLEGPPDGNFDHARFEWRLELQPEVDATTFGPSTIGSDTLQLVPNEYAGMSVRITAGKGRGQERVIVGHTSEVITVQGSWATVPDATSRFVIVESSWNFGSTGRTSPIRFAIPNRPGATIHIVGLAVNAAGRDSGYALAPLTRWLIGGGAGSGIDLDVPPMPAFGLDLVGQGTVEVVAVAFSTLANTRSISAGTLKLHYWNELASPTPVTLATAIAAGDTEISFAGGSASEGALIQVEAEVMEVATVGAGGVLTVARGAFGTAAASHASGTLAYMLDRSVFVVPFPRDFFGSPASGSYACPIFIPDVRIAAAELFMTNSRGNGQTRRVNFTATTDLGLRTLSGGQLTIQVEGPLAIQTAAAPPLVVETAHSVQDVFAVIREAPTGAPIQLRLRVDTSEYCTLTILAGATASNVVPGFGKAALTAASRLFLDIVSVAQTAESSPGRDLTVVVRL
jgi:hypothetical protein